jgi:rod shape determining protein RodA
MMRPAVGRGDPWLLLSVLVLAPLGVLMIYTSSIHAGDELRVSGPALRQLLVALAGVAAMLALARFDYRALRRLSAPAYAVALVLLIAVLAAGASEYGARRWLGVGGATMQPSELAKLAMVLMLAAYLSERTPKAASVIASFGILLAPLALVAWQPDAGTALVFTGAWLGIVVAWGVPWRLLGGLLVVVAAFVPLMFAVAVPGYQRERIAVFLDPTRDPLGSGFALQQAEAALRSGGLTGRGLFEGGGSALDGVAARSSDFIFAQVGEQLGLAGAVLLLALLCLLIWRGLRASLIAPDAFGRLLAAGLTMTIFVQAFVHVAVNLRLLPATGIPLPFISQGGSSLLMMCVAAGLLQSIASRRPASSREQWSAERWL